MMDEEDIDEFQFKLWLTDFDTDALTEYIDYSREALAWKDLRTLELWKYDIQMVDVVECHDEAVFAEVEVEGE